MSARAAARLDSFGFRRVYEYANGKSDWFAAGLSRGGDEAAVPRIGDFAEDAMTCSPAETVRDVRSRMRETGATACAVVNEGGVVLGLVRAKGLGRADGQARIAEALHPGPKTYRADYTLDDPLEYMETNGLDSVLVTSPEGVLLGLTPLEPVKRFMERLARLEKRTARG
jgi:CBS domain-containing protein